GNTGLINIVTKKNMKQGLRGSATAAYRRNNYGNPSLSTTLSYRSEKWNITCNANAGVYAYKYTNLTNTYYPDQNWEQKLVQGYFSKNARVQIALDYSLNKN